MPVMGWGCQCHDPEDEQEEDLWRIVITGYYYDSLIFAHVNAGSCGCVCTVWTVQYTVRKILVL